MTKVFKLSDVNLNVNEIEVLRFLKDNGRPALIEVPANRNIWGIDIRHYSSSELYGGFIRPFSPQLQQKASYIQLNHIDLVALIENGNCIVKDSDLIVCFNSQGEPVTQSFIVNEVKLNVTREANNFAEYASAELESGCLNSGLYLAPDNTKFIITNKRVHNAVSLDDLTDSTESLAVTLNSIFVFQKDIQPFIIESLDSIPSGSDYFIPKKLRGLSDIDKLAEIGYQAKINAEAKGGKVKSADLSYLIQDELDYPVKKADAAAFFLNPHPSSRSSTCKSGCQFPFLINAIELHWQNPSSNFKTVIRDVTDFFKFEGFADDNAKYAELIIRPKKFRGVKKL